MATTLAVMVFSATMILSPSAAPRVQEGIVAWQQNDPAKAVAIWRPLAEKGDPDAAFNLGQAYRLGRGAVRDLVRSKQWYEEAARKGHVNAQTALGLQLLQQGDSVSAVRWLKSAAENGEPRAMLAYGTALFNGQGVAPDRNLARSFVSRAADLGVEPAKKALVSLDQMLLEQPLEPQAESTKAEISLEVTRGDPLSPSPAALVEGSARTTALAEGPWRIQLGAFSQRATAENLFERLTAGPGLLAQKQMFLQRAGSVVRLQVGPFPSRASAAAACAKLAAKGQPCFPVRSK